MSKDDKWMPEINNFTISDMDLNIFYLQWGCFGADADLWSICKKREK